jgi:hypothetical protein
MTSDKIQAIAQKLAQVGAAIEAVPKMGKIELGRNSYAYARDAELFAAVRDELFHRGVALVVDVESTEFSSTRETRRDGSEFSSTLATVLLSIRVVDGDSGEWIATRAVGQGSDTGDKALYKAITGALKYWCRATFLIATGDDPDATASPQPRQRADWADRPKAAVQAAPSQAAPPKKLSPAGQRASELAAELEGRGIAGAMAAIQQTAIHLAGGATAVTPRHVAIAARVVEIGSALAISLDIAPELARKQLLAGDCTSPEAVSEYARQLIDNATSSPWES